MLFPIPGKTVGRKPAAAAQQLDRWLANPSRSKQSDANLQNGQNGENDHIAKTGNGYQFPDAAPMDDALKTGNGYQFLTSTLDEYCMLLS